MAQDAGARPEHDRPPRSKRAPHERTAQVGGAEAKQAYYNYAVGTFAAPEGPGVSVFYKDADGAIYHTYSCYARGLDILNGAYHLLDLVPKGRDEERLTYTMEWLRHRDRYDDRQLVPGGLKAPPRR